MKLSIVVAAFLVLAILRLTGTIHLSWLWVTAPLWGNVALVVAIMGTVELIKALANE